VATSTQSTPLTTAPGGAGSLNPNARRAAAMRRQRRRKGLVFAAMALLAVIMLYPFYFMISTSLKSENQFVNGGGFSLSSWSALGGTLPWLHELLNSTIVCTCAIAIIVAVASPAGFAFAKLHFRMSNFVLMGIVAAMLIPVQSIVIPLYVNAAHLHVVNSYLAAVVIYAALGTPFATFLMTAYYRSLPDEVVEAAIIDGARHLGVFGRIALPMSGPALVTIAVLQFIQIWDDLLVGMLFLQNPSERTITVGLGALASGRVTNVPVLMAGSLISAIPAMVVFLIFQRFLTSGLTAGISK
jgi:multiple sugar transport system permease protein/raffinose/stachyose/melibiose transport system permease protein